MRIFLLIMSFLTISCNCSSQDWIKRNNGKNINSEILSFNYITQVSHKQVDKKTVISISNNQISQVSHIVQQKDTTLSSDSIYIRKESGFYEYYHNGVQLEKRELKELLNSNNLAHKQIMNSYKIYAAATLFSIAGVVLIAIPINTAIKYQYDSPQWYLAVAGGVSIILAIPIALTAKSNLHDAIDIYNQGLSKTKIDKPEILLGFTQHGLGIRLVF